MSGIPGRPLSGQELKKVILNDFQNILDQDGMLANHIAYGRVAYDVTLRVHIDNPSYPEHLSVTKSRKATLQEIGKNPDVGLEALETFPLKEPSEDAVVGGKTRKRKIVDTNLARIENELPIQINVRNPDGTVEPKLVKYTYDDVGAEVIAENKPVDHGFEDVELNEKS